MGPPDLLQHHTSKHCGYIISLLSASNTWASLAGTRAQSGDRCGSGTLHPGQVLRGSLPLLSPAFGASHFRRQVPLRPRDTLAAKCGTMDEKVCPVTLPT
jgi:hypothetical protein